MSNIESFQPREDLEKYTEKFFGRLIGSKANSRSVSQRLSARFASAGPEPLKPGERTLEVDGQRFKAIDLGGRNVPEAFRARKGGAGPPNKYGR